MKTAVEANKEALKNKKKIKKAQEIEFRKDVYTDIQDAIERGDTYLFVLSAIDTELRAELEALGYKVKAGTDCTSEISWKTV